MKTAEYTIGEIQSLMKSMSSMYDLARIVDPIECRVLQIQDGDSFCMSEKCYDIWDSEQRCKNCSSATARRTGCHREKTECFRDKEFHIQSNPVKIKLPDGGSYDAVVELVSITDKPEESETQVNDREAENTTGDGVRFLANNDELTGLLKADAFYEKTRGMLAEENKAWTMIISDIMDFRLVNSLYGVERGNEVLAEVAELHKKIADEGNGLCCRMHGDRFAVLLPASSYRESTLAKTAQTLNERFSSGIYTLCIHFGVYEITNPQIPVSVMCDRANMALRKIHRDLRTNVAYFDDAIMQQSLAEQEVISAFEDALKENRFHMYLQPITVESGEPFGAEALARWIRPDGKMVPPSEFIEILENAGMIHELDKNIWEQAVKQLAEWENTDKKDLTISVNISVKDFYCMDVYKTLKDLTDKYGVDSSKLRLEITESVLIDNPERIYPVLAKLQEAGFIIEIDDFGKGQSSLSLLKDIKADILKIDMGFLRETENKKRSQIILKSVIAMANALGMQVITEGVETETQVRFLTTMGCTRFQGFYFSRPIPVKEFEEKYGIAQ